MAQTKIEQGLLNFTEATDYLQIPTGTTAHRPGTASAGTELDKSAYTTLFDSDGFTLAQAGGNTNVPGSTYIYMAFKIN